MDYLTWYYSKGVEYYVTSWFANLEYTSRYYSLGLLLKTLFSPWKRLIVVDKSPGFNLARWFESFTFNLISRGIGAIVRLTLFFSAIVILIFAFLGGLIGLVVWLLLPFLGLNIYKKYVSQPRNIIGKLVNKLQATTEDIKTIFDSEPGKFVVDHIGVTVGDLQTNASMQDVVVGDVSSATFSDLMKILLQKEVWSPDFLRSRQLEPADIFTASLWWDIKKTEETQLVTTQLGRPAIGLELLFGYTPNLTKYSVNLSSPKSFEKHLIGRSEVVNRMERILVGGSSVILIGQPGVGKKTVVLEFAYRAAIGEFGSKMAYKQVLEFDYNAFLSESFDINYKKTRLAQILSEASSAGNVILMIKDIHRLTNPDVEGYDFTDIFEEYMEKRNLNIIAVATQIDYERFVAPNMRLRKHLERVEVTPPSKKEAQTILLESATKWEKTTHIVIRTNSLRHILEESDRYITETPFPEKALELLDAVVEYAKQKSKSVVTLEEVNIVLAEKTGISFSRLTSEESAKLGNLEEIIHKRLVNQEAAVDLIAKSLRSRTAGVSRDTRPIGSFLFLGPTGVGKTETAKVLAKVYYGAESSILRFDMAEFVGYEGLERLIGSVARNRPGVLTTAIKNKPSSLLLLDEFEKATPEISNLFLTLLDEGYITDAFGNRINGRHLFIIGTSNAGAEYVRELVSGGMAMQELQKKVVDYVLEKQIFSPEFLNRFDGVVVYEPLSRDNLVEVAKHMLFDLANNLQRKSIHLEVTDDIAFKLAQDGYDPAFGARPMRRIVNLILGDLIGKAMLGGVVKEGDRIKIVPKEGQNQYEIVNTPTVQPTAESVT